MESLLDGKSDNFQMQGSHDESNVSNQFIDEISFPFIPCHYSKHKKFGPQTVISHFLFDAQKNDYTLFCNTCLKDLEKKNPHIQPSDIEEFVEKFLQKLTPGQLESPEPSSGLIQAYELKQQHVVTFKKRIEKETQGITQMFDDIINEVTKMITEQRDQIIKSYNSLSDIFTQSYDLFNIKFERLFKSNDMLNQLKSTNEFKIKDDLQEIRTELEYQSFVKQMKNLDELCQELMNREKKNDELIQFSQTLQRFYQILPPAPPNGKVISELCIKSVSEPLNQVFNKYGFKAPRSIEKVSCIGKLKILTPLDHFRTCGIF